jgi:FdhD protein
MTGTSVSRTAIIRVGREQYASAEDMLAVEEPLEIQLAYRDDAGNAVQKSISVTMRTPGRDTALGAGFLFTEGIVQHRDQVEEIMIPGENQVLLKLAEGVQPVLNKTERNFYTTSSCGVCGKSSIDAIRTTAAYSVSPQQLQVTPELLYGLPQLLRAQQELFESTGGLHAAALFDLEGNFITLQEDVGRHNALDKVIGAAFMEGHLPLHKVILLLSGRASFELVQKAAMAGIPVIAAVGAPSSLAVSLAAEQGITLAGFLRGERFNIYSVPGRITNPIQ